MKPVPGYIAMPDNSAEDGRLVPRRRLMPGKVPSDQIRLRNHVVIEKEDEWTFALTDTSVAGHAGSRTSLLQHPHVRQSRNVLVLTVDNDDRLEALHRLGFERIEGTPQDLPSLTGWDHD